MARLIGNGLDPYQTLLDLQSEINDLFNLGPAGDSFLSRRRATFPRVNVATGGEESVLLAELPGVPEEALELTVEGDTLTLKGERSRHGDVPAERFYRCERGYGRFGRSIRLPHRVDAGKVEAVLTNGILKVTLPKAPEDKPKKVLVNG